MKLLGAVLPALDPALARAPSPHDGHHAHAQVRAGAGHRALEAHPGPTPPLWLWGVVDLPFPTMIAPFDRVRLAEIKHAIAAHASELARLPLDRLVEARAVLAAGVGEERVHGSDLAAHPSVELAELLCEVMLEPGGWMLGTPRRFDADAPIASASKRAIGWWLEGESVHARLRRGG